MKTELTGIGELLIDLTPAGFTPEGVALFSRNPGGGVPNMLNMFAKLGGRAALISRVGEDEFGRYLARALAENGVGCDRVFVQPNARTTLAIVQLDEQGERSFDFYREITGSLLLRPEEIEEADIAKSGMLHVSSMPLTAEPSRSAAYKAMAAAKDAGVPISYDPNYRKRLWQELDTARAEMLCALRQVDILKVSDDELLLLTGESDIKAGAKRLLGEGPSLVLVSMGAEGSCFFTDSVSGYEPSFKVKVVDTTGAGDAFLGALLYGLRGCDVPQLKALTGERLHHILRAANAAGALTATGFGAIPSLPSREEIEKLTGERIESP